MSSAPRTLVDESVYTPVDRVENRSGWMFGLVALVVTGAGLYLLHGTVGLGATAVLLVLWTRLRAEFVFAANVAVLAGTGGDLLSPGSVLAMAGGGALLAVELGRTWGSVGPVAAFCALFTAGFAGIAYTSDEVALLWVGLGSVATLSVVSYVLYRYQRVRTARAEDSGDESATGPSENQRSDQRSDMT